MARSDSDPRYFSKLLVLAIIVAPALGGACLFSGECPVRTSDCHEQEGLQTAPTCCETTAALVSRWQGVEVGSPSVAPASWAALPGVADGVVRGRAVPPRSNPPPANVAPLFVAHGSYLL